MVAIRSMMLLAFEVVLGDFFLVHLLLSVKSVSVKCSGRLFQSLVVFGIKEFLFARIWMELFLLL